jgi:hypothetical protein
MYRLLPLVTAALAGYAVVCAQQPGSCDQKLISYLDWQETPETAWSLQLSAATG